MQCWREVTKITGQINEKQNKTDSWSIGHQVTHDGNPWEVGPDCPRLLPWALFQAAAQGPGGNQAVLGGDRVNVHGGPGNLSSQENNCKGESSELEKKAGFSLYTTYNVQRWLAQGSFLYNKPLCHPPVGTAQFYNLIALKSHIVKTPKLVIFREIFFSGLGTNL